MSQKDEGGSGGGSSSDYGDSGNPAFE